MNFKKILALFGFFTLISGFVFSQEETSINDDEIEEVVVVGIKKSLQDAIDIKRSNVGVVDAITAEDFGKFPDNNLAESLARIVGIGIDRNNVEGERVAVRGFGPEFNLVTLNGRQMPTVPGQYEGGRSFNFGDISSHGISAVEVYKSTDSSLPSGGIGSTINIVTTKPLEMDGRMLSYSVNLVEDTTSTESRTFETNFVYAENFGNLGFSISASWQDRNNREEGTRESNWITLPLDDPARVDFSNPNITNNNQRADGNAFYQEPTAYQFKDNDRFRFNHQATLQYAFSEKLVATLDYTVSEVDFKSNGQMFGSWLGGWTTLSGTINSNGAFTDVVVGERSYDHQFIWGNTESRNESTGLNFAWDLSEALSFELDIHDSSAEKDGTELPNEMGFTTPQGTVTHTNGGPNGINSFVYDFDITANDFSHTGLYYRDAFKSNMMEQIQFKGSWTNLRDGALRSVDFGMSEADSKFTDVRAEQNTALAPAVAADPTLFTRTSLSGFMDGFNLSNAGYYFAIDPTLAKRAWINNVGAFNSGDIDTHDRVEEELTSYFIQGNFEFTVNDNPLNVVAGIRIEETETISTSLEDTPTNIRWDMIEGLTYITGGIVDAPVQASHDVVLPQIAAAYEFEDDKVFRMSYGESMARPSLKDLRSSLQFGNRDYFVPTATGGNPNLEPLMSTNFDMAYEWYYAEGSYLSVNYFNKEIDGFISTEITEGDLYGLRNPAFGEIGLYAQACVAAWDAAGRPDPGFPGDAGATGHCVSQQALWAQSWMNLYQHMGWVAVAMSRGIDVSAGFPWGACDYDGWWRCDPGYLDATSDDPLAMFEISRPGNLESGEVDGFEFVLQHLFGDTGFGVTFNGTLISGGDVDIDTAVIGEQFILPGLGDSANASVFYEDEKFTSRLALNHRGDTIVGFGNYDQPLYVQERNQLDLTLAYRPRENTEIFFYGQNINDENTRLYARHKEMLFLAQDHGPIYRLGIRLKF